MVKFWLFDLNSCGWRHTVNGLPLNSSLGDGFKCTFPPIVFLGRHVVSFTEGSSLCIMMIYLGRSVCHTSQNGRIRWGLLQDSCERRKMKGTSQVAEICTDSYTMPPNKLFRVYGQQNQLLPKYHYWLFWAAKIIKTISWIPLFCFWFHCSFLWLHTLLATVENAKISTHFSWNWSWCVDIGDSLGKLWLKARQLFTLLWYDRSNWELVLENSVPKPDYMASYIVCLFWLKLSHFNWCRLEQVTYFFTVYWKIGLFLPRSEI